MLKYRENKHSRQPRVDKRLNAASTLCAICLGLTLNCGWWITNEALQIFRNTELDCTLNVVKQNLVLGYVFITFTNQILITTGRGIPCMTVTKPMLENCSTAGSFDFQFQGHYCAGWINHCIGTLYIVSLLAWWWMTVNNYTWSDTVLLRHICFSILVVIRI